MKMMMIKILVKVDFVRYLKEEEKRGKRREESVR